MLTVSLSIDRGDRVDEVDKVLTLRNAKVRMLTASVSIDRADRVDEVDEVDKVDQVMLKRD